MKPSHSLSDGSKVPNQKADSFISASRITTVPPFQVILSTVNCHLQGKKSLQWTVRYHPSKNRQSFKKI